MAHCHIRGIPKLVIASINIHRRVAQVSGFYMLLTESPFGGNLKDKVSFNMIQEHKRTGFDPCFYLFGTFPPPCHLGFRYFVHTMQLIIVLYYLGFFFYLCLLTQLVFTNSFKTF